MEIQKYKAMIQEKRIALQEALAFHRGRVDQLRARITEEPRNGDLYWKLGESLVILSCSLIATDDEIWDYIVWWEFYTSGMEEARKLLELALALGISTPLETAKARYLLLSLTLSFQSATRELPLDTRNESHRNDSEEKNGAVLFAAWPHMKPVARAMIADAQRHLRYQPHNLEAAYLKRAGLMLLQEDPSKIEEAELALRLARRMKHAGLLTESTSSTVSTASSIPLRNDGIKFETLTLRLLTAMGFNATTTKSSGDGGIDVVAVNTSPIISGTYIVQCKDWAEPVGEPVVRDLYGAVTAERANKGILIVSGRFTPAAERFAQGKPIELIDGVTLARLLQQYQIEQG